MKALLVLVPLVLAGCGSGVGSAVTDVEGTSDSTPLGAELPDGEAPLGSEDALVDNDADGVPDDNDACHTRRFRVLREIQDRHASMFRIGSKTGVG